jgi:phage-related protein
VASDAEVDLLVNATRALPELERDLARVISTAERNADDIDLNAVVDVRDSIDNTLRDLDRVRRAAEAGADDIDLLAVIDQINSLTGLRNDVDSLATQVGNQAPDIDLTAVLNRTRSLSTVTRDLNRVVRAAQAAAPDIDIDVDVDSNAATRGLRGFSQTLASATQTALSAGASFARVGAATGAVGVAAGAAIPLVAAFVGELQNMLPAAAVGTSALLAIGLAAGTVKLAMHGVGEAIEAAFDPDADPEELAKAMRRLAPEARAFVTELQRMRAPLRELQQRVQGRFFEGFDASLRDLSRAVLPSVRTALDSTSTSLNRMARGAADSGRDLGESGILGSALKSATRSLENLERVPGQVVGAFGRLAAAAGPSLERLTKAVSDKSDEISENLARAFESGALEKSIEDAIDAVKQLGRIGGNVLGGLRNVVSGLTQDGNFLFERLEKITQAFEDLTASDEAQEFFKALSVAIAGLNSVLTPVLSLVGELAKLVLPVLTRILEFAAELFERLSPVVQELADTIGAALTPIINGLNRVLDLVLPKFRELADETTPELQKAWSKLRPLVEELGEALGELLVALGPIIVSMLDLTFTLLNHLLPVIGPILKVALMAIIGIIRLLTLVIKELQPVIRAIAQVFRGDFGGAMRSSADLTSKFADRAQQAFGRLVSAIQTAVLRSAVSLSSGFSRMFGDALSRVGDFVRGLGVSMTRIPSIVKQALAGAGSYLLNAGADIVRGLIRGMASQLGRLRSIASEIANVVSGTVKNILKISSPSREFRDIGDDTIQGFINGLRAAAPGLEDEMRRITADFQAAAPGPQGAAGLRFTVPTPVVPDVNVFIGGEPLDKRIVTVADQRVYTRERTVARRVR